MKVDDLILKELLDEIPSAKIYLSTKRGSSAKYATVKINKATNSEKKFIKNIFNNYIYAFEKYQSSKYSKINRHKRNI